MTPASGTKIPSPETVEGRAKRLGLEPKAIDQSWCNWGSSEGEVQTSMAISLKRIADQMASLNDTLDSLCVGARADNQNCLRVYRYE